MDAASHTKTTTSAAITLPRADFAARRFSGAASATQSFAGRTIATDAEGRTGRRFVLAQVGPTTPVIV